MVCLRVCVFVRVANFSAAYPSEIHNNGRVDKQKYQQQRLTGNKEIKAIHGEPEENLECQLEVGKMDCLNPPPITKQRIGCSID